jgi:hypothetical protein
MRLASAVLLCATTGLALVLQVASALRWNPGHDEIWHLLYAKVLPFRAFIAEIKHEAHPPLTHLLRRSFVPREDAFLLWPRLLSVLPGTLLVPVLFATARRLGLATPSCLAGTFFVALSHAHTTVSVTVRSYAFAMLFVMCAHLVFLSVWRRPSNATRWSLAVLLGCSAVAMLSLYASALPLAAMCCAILMLRPDPLRAAGELWKRAGKPEVAVFAAALAGLVAYYLWTWKVDFLGHVEYWFRRPGESLLGFAARGVASTLGAFASVEIPPGSGSAVAAVSFAGLLLSAVVLELLPGGRDPARAGVVLVTVLLWVGVFFLSVLDVYPFGGEVRHQYVLFPFTVLSSLLVLDRVCRRLRSRAIRGSLLAVAMLAAALSSISGFSGRPLDDFPARPLHREEFSRVRSRMGPEDALFVTRYGIISVFANTMDWRWTRAERLEDRYDVFHVRKGNELLVVLRDRSLWVFPLPPEGSVPADVARVMERKGLEAVWIWSASPDGDRYCGPDQVAWALHGLKAEPSVPLENGEAFRVRLTPR